MQKSPNVSFRLPPDDRELLRALAQRHAVPQTMIVRLALRALADAPVLPFVEEAP